MKRFDEILKRWEAPFDKTEEQSWEAIQLKISSEIRPQTRVVGFRRYYWAAAAAVVVLALGIWWFLPAEDTMAVANTGKDPITITLPDGSKAILNAGTTLSYAHENDIRTVSLSGEAYFEVVHGKPFEVHGNQGVVRVLGTRFNVYDRAGMYQVSCFEGRVAVMGERELILPGGEGVVVLNGEWNKTFVEPGQKTWQDGEYHFDNTPLNIVLEEIERQFAVTVESPNLEGRTYTGFFRDDNLEEALELLCTALGLDYTVQENAIVRLTEKQY